MGNCLVTKLKERVDNDSLKELGVLTLPISTGYTGKAVIFRHKDGENPCTLKFFSPSGELVSTYTSLPDTSSDSWIYPNLPDGGIAKIYNKYDLVMASNISVDRAKTLPNAEDYKYMYYDTSSVYGYDSMDNWGKIGKLPMGVHLQKGDVLDYVAERIAAGETTGDKYISWFNGGSSDYVHSTVRFNKTYAENSTYPFDGYKCKLCWNGDKVWLLLCKGLWTKGLSDEEIAELRTEAPYTLVESVIKTD